MYAFAFALALTAAIVSPVLSWLYIRRARRHHNSLMMLLCGTHVQEMRELESRNMEAKNDLDSARRQHETEMADLAAVCAEEIELLRRKHRAETVQTARLLARRMQADERARDERRVAGLLAALEAKVNQLFQAGRYEQATAPLEQIVAVAQYCGKRSLEATALHNLAKAYQRMGELLRAEILFRQAYNIGQEEWAGKEGPYAERLAKYRQRWLAAERTVNIVRIENVLGQAAQATMINPEYAAKLFERAAALAEEHELPEYQAMALNNSWRVRMEAFDLEDAQKTLEKALSVAKKVKDNETLVTAIEYNLGTVMSHQKAKHLELLLDLVHRNMMHGRGPQAEQFARQAVREACRVFGGNDWRVALAWDRVGLALMMQEEPTRALEQFELAETIISENPQSQRALAMEIQQHMELAKRVS